jgi:DNA-binding transcriptional MocR family regulator
MARYLQVSSEVAADVESGALGPGDELPSIRAAAHRYKTTGSIISRAYRHLADAGVIDIEDRRRARVTADGVRAAAEALDLHFVPVAWEDFDIVLSSDALAAAEPLIAAVRDPVVQSSVCALGGYDISRAGAVELLT